MPDKPSSKPATTRPMPPLTDAEKRIIIDKGTEEPFTGKYWNHFKRGTYICRQCGAPLYVSVSKFESDCGWPSFDDEISGAVKRQPDADGRRTEIICTACGAHLGHVFLGESLTKKNTRHCVNSASIVFVAEKAHPTEKAIFAAGCFWGVEHRFEQVAGVLSVHSGYTGGTAANPTYEQVCTGATGHAEAVEVVFDPAKVTYGQLVRLFFQMHDPTQLNRQGPDVGAQYRSAIFYLNEGQKRTAEKLIGELRKGGRDVVTQLVADPTFWDAEEYHQDYIRKHQKDSHDHRAKKKEGS